MKQEITMCALILMLLLDSATPTKKGTKDRFKSLTSTILSDTTAIIRVVTDQSEGNAHVEILCTLYKDSIAFQGTVLPNNRNVNIYYKTSIKLK